MKAVWPDSSSCISCHSQHERGGRDVVRLDSRVRLSELPTKLPRRDEYSTEPRSRSRSPRPGRQPRSTPSRLTLGSKCTKASGPVRFPYPAAAIKVPEPYHTGGLAIVYEFNLTPAIESSDLVARRCPCVRVELRSDRVVYCHGANRAPYRESCPVTHMEAQTSPVNC